MANNKYLGNNFTNHLAEEGSVRYQTEERLVNYAVSILDFCVDFPNTNVGRYYSDQLSRAAGSSALNYGEAQAAESRRDFVHKMKISLKELRETLVCLKIITRSKCFAKTVNGATLLKEADELVSIFVASLKTMQSRDAILKKPQKPK